MTEIELNKSISELEPRDEFERHISMKSRRRIRRTTQVFKKDDRLKIINYSGYAPHLGYVDCAFDGKTLLHSGKYIKYPKNSKCQRWMKRETSRRTRNCKDISVKSNSYRRLFDYWWTLY